MNRVSGLFLSGALALGSLVAFSPSVEANEMDRLANNLCESAKTDDRSLMRKTLEKSNINLRNIYDAVICGSEGSLLRVATNSGSLNAAKYIATKIKKDDLTRPESDGKSIIEFAQALVASGDSSKQEFVDLYKGKLES